MSWKVLKEFKTKKHRVQLTSYTSYAVQWGTSEQIRERSNYIEPNLDKAEALKRCHEMIEKLKKKEKMCVKKAKEEEQ